MQNNPPKSLYDSLYSNDFPSQSFSLTLPAFNRQMKVIAPRNLVSSSKEGTKSDGADNIILNTHTRGENNLNHMPFENFWWEPMEYDSKLYPRGENPENLNSELFKR